MVAEFPEGFGAQVGQFMLLPVSPQVLHGVEFGRVGGQALQLQPTVNETFG